MRAVVYDRPESFSVQEIDDLPMGPSQVRVRPLVVGVCGTDDHLHHGEFGPRYPLVPGHEIVGEVAEVGDLVRGIAIGERVAVDNTLHCMRCTACMRGRFGLCQDAGALGVTHPGGFAEQVVADAHKIYPIGDLDLDAAALIEPTACVVHGMDVLGLTPGDDVLLIGAGPTAQILAQTIARGGASRVTMAAPTRFKLDVARNLGVHQIIELARGDFAASVSRMREVAPGGFDVVVEATGSTDVLAHALGLVADGGSLMVYGMAAERSVIEIEPFEIFRRELSIKGSFAHAHGFARAIDLLSNGVVRADGIITHRFDLDHYADALGALRSSDCLKAVIEI